MLPTLRGCRRGEREKGKREKETCPARSDYSSGDGEGENERKFIALDNPDMIPVKPEKKKKRGRKQAHKQLFSSPLKSARVRWNGRAGGRMKKKKGGKENGRRICLKSFVHDPRSRLGLCWDRLGGRGGEKRKKGSEKNSC